MNVYLHELDIDEYGTEISLPCDIAEYLLKFVFFTDEVYLQSSSTLKRQDLFFFFQRHPDLFGTDGIDGANPCIAFVLDPRYESISDYTDDRLRILSTHSDKGQNTELAIYKSNRAEKRASEVDHIVSSGDIRRRDHDVNIFFKHNLLNLEIPIIGDDITKGLETIYEYVLHNAFIQTFELMNRIEGVVANRNSSKIIGKYIRKCYFEANAAAVGCDFHNRDWHLCYENINQYAELIGLNRIFNYNWELDRFLVTSIKNIPSYKSLIAMYYNFSDTQRFRAFCDYVYTRKSNPLYVFYEIAYFGKLKAAFQSDMKKLKDKTYHEERG